MHPESEALEVRAVMPHNTILAAVAGSKAFGLDTPESDTDFTGVFVTPLRKFVDPRGHGADTITKSVANGDPVDAAFHELGKFCRLALAGNPTVLETLWSPPRYLTPAGIGLTEARRGFLSKASLKPYFGYYTSQRRRLEAGMSVHTTGGEWNPKFGAHMLRLLLAAEHLAKTGEVLVSLREHTDYALLKSVRAGEVEQGKCLELTDRWYKDAQAAETTTVLPDHPDGDAAAAFVYETRLAYK